MVRKLDSQQQVELEKLSRIDFEWRNAKVGIETEVRRIVAEQIQDIEIERARQVHALRALGVPKSQINQFGLHTKDPRAADSVMDARPLLARIGVAQVAGKVEEVFAWEDRANKIIRVNFPEYEMHEGNQNFGQQFGNEVRKFTGTVTGLVKISIEPTFGREYFEVLEDGNAVPEDERPEARDLRAFVTGPLTEDLKADAEWTPLNKALKNWLATQTA